MNKPIALILAGISLLSATPAVAATTVIAGILVPDTFGMIRFRSGHPFQGGVGLFDLKLDRPVSGILYADYGVQYYTIDVFNEYDYGLGRFVKRYEYGGNELGDGGYGFHSEFVGDQFRNYLRASGLSQYSSGNGGRSEQHYFLVNQVVEFSGQVAGPQPVGYTLTITSAGGVPEPDSWALMIAGFGMAGAGLRRARRLQWQARLA